MDKYTLMSRAGIWNKEVIKLSHIINENQNNESGLMVNGRNSIDNNKIGKAIESLGLYGEWNREGFWFLEEEQDMYDELEAILTKEFDKQNIQNYSIQGIW